MKKLLLLIPILVIGIFLLTGCQTEADKVSYNLSQEADNFNVARKITVINCIEGDVLFQMSGRLSLYADTGDNQLEITVEDEDGSYKKHFIGLSDNVTYVVEDLGGNDVSKYKYTLNYNPKMWIPIEAAISKISRTRTTMFSVSQNSTMNAWFHKHTSFELIVLYHKWLF